ncbi:hypothetical protein BDD12DRAFT_245510 [Trichophaea hybrida]|nr:hypothetical protein BDD12DRAFT_245510 [Trichophaea hybrida]
MSKSNISVFLPIFFSALVICGIVLCTCAYCHRPNFLFLGGSRYSDSDSTSSSEKGEHRPHGSHGDHSGHGGPVIMVEPESATYGPPGGFEGPSAEPVDIVEAVPDAEVIDVVEAHPDLD